MKTYTRTNKSLLTLTFLLGLFMAVFRTAFFPSLVFIPFVPTLAYFYLHCRFIHSLWLAFFLGLIIDLLSTTFFGMHALIYSVVTLLTYRYKRFFDEKWVSIFLYSFIISLGISLTEVIISGLISQSIHLSFYWILTDILAMPIIDGIYGILWFVLPIKLLKQIQYRLLRFNLMRRNKWK